MNEITDKDKLECITREAVLRRAVYQHWVIEGKMTVAQAGDDIARLEAIVSDYRKILEGSP